MFCETKKALALIIALGLLGTTLATPGEFPDLPDLSDILPTPAPVPTPTPCGPIDVAGSNVSVGPGSQGSLIKVSFRAANAGDQARNSETLRGVLEPLDDEGKAVTSIGVDETCAYEPAPAAADGAATCGGFYTCSRGIPASMIPAAHNATSQTFSFRVRATLSECIEVAGPGGASAVECFGLKVARYVVRVDQGVEGGVVVTVETADEVALNMELRPKQEVGEDLLRVGARAAVTLGVEQDGFAVLPGRTRVWASWYAVDGSASTLPAAMAADGEGYRMGATMRASDDGMDTVVEFTASPPATQNGVLEVPLPARLVLLWEAEAQVVGQAAPAATGGAQGGARRQGGAGAGRRVSGRRELYVAGEAGGGSAPPVAPSGGGRDDGGRVVVRGGGGGQGPSVSVWVLLAVAIVLIFVALCGLWKLVRVAGRGAAAAAARPAGSGGVVVQSSLFFSSSQVSPRPVVIESVPTVASPVGAPKDARDCRLYPLEIPHPAGRPTAPPQIWTPRVQPAGQVAEFRVDVGGMV